MALVFVTTIVFGALMPYVVRYMRTFDPPAPVNTEIENMPKVNENLGADHDTSTHDHDDCKHFNYEFIHPNYVKK